VSLARLFVLHAGAFEHFFAAFGQVPHAQVFAGAAAF
jgi:hypothetical protein